MNYSVLPPEINSLRMFTGAGSAPMLAARPRPGRRYRRCGWGRRAGGAAGAVTTITHASFNDPHGVAVNPGGNVYVTNFGSGTVSVINPATNTVTGSPITIGNGPSGVAVSPVTGLVFVTNFDSNTVSVIDPTTNTVTGSPITVGTAPTGVAVNPVTGEVYVTNFAGDTVSVIS